MQAKRWFVGLMMVVSALVGCGPAVENAEATEHSALVTCGERPQSTCGKSVGCEFLTGCCDGLCVDLGQTCPVVCPPPPAEESAVKPVSASGDPYTPCTRNSHCTEFSQLYCGGDPGLCFQSKYCLCP